MICMISLLFSTSSSKCLPLGFFGSKVIDDVVMWQLLASLMTDADYGKTSTQIGIQFLQVFFCGWRRDASMQSRHLMARQVANFLSQRWYVNVLQSLSHWLHNPTSSSFLKLSSPPNMALTSPSVSKLSFKICSLFTASTIGLSGDS